MVWPVNHMTSQGWPHHKMTLTWRDQLNTWPTGHTRPIKAEENWHKTRQPKFHWWWWRKVPKLNNKIREQTSTNLYSLSYKYFPPFISPTISVMMAGDLRNTKGSHKVGKGCSKHFAARLTFSARCKVNWPGFFLKKYFESDLNCNQCFWMKAVPR